MTPNPLVDLDVVVEARRRLERARFLEPLAAALEDPVTRRGLEDGGTTVIVLVDGLADDARAALEQAAP